MSVNELRESESDGAAMAPGFILKTVDSDASRRAEKYRSLRVVLHGPFVDARIAHTACRQRSTTSTPQGPSALPTSARSLPSANAPSTLSTCVP